MNRGEQLGIFLIGFGLGGGIVNLLYAFADACVR